jgi:rubrerythrin
MAKKSGVTDQIHELLYQALETEAGGMQVYQAAIECAINEDLRKEWQEYLEETTTHHSVLMAVFESLGLNPEVMTPGREVVSHHGESLVKAIVMAKQAGDPPAAQLVAAECVVLAETKDHSNWELIGMVAEKSTGELAKVLKKAHQAVEKDEDHHLYHTKGWTRELWIESLGYPAVLPPPEEVKQVETAIGASRAEQARDQMLNGRH